MKFFIPSVGEHFKLTADWEFPLFTEYRNESLVNYLEPNQKTSYGRGLESIPCLLKAGTVLAVKKIYIRSGKKEFDSITFGIRSMEGLPKKHRQLTFWAKLADVNEVECERVEK